MKGKKTKKSHDETQEYALVYSTDPAGSFERQSQSAPVAEMPRTIGRPRNRVERKGRGGKTVTVITGLAPHPFMLTELCGALKKWLGCGGSCRLEGNEGIVELQGDRSNQLEPLLVKFMSERLGTK